MSTRDESPEDCEPLLDWRDIPAHERARPGDFAGLTAAAWVQPERLELVRAALKFAERLEVVGSLDELLAADADLIVVSSELLPEPRGEERARLLRNWRSALDPIRVVIDAPFRSRVALQIGCGVDLAVEPGIDALDLQARVQALLRRARLERDRNPLTGLPGNRWLRRQLAETLADERAVGLLLLDIDDFKRYNDTHGHLRGDAAIELLAAVARTSADPAAGSFAAHIGGDDFCIVCPPEALDDLAATCLSAFAERSCAVAGGAALTITAAGTIVPPPESDSLEETFVRLARLKSEGKRRPGSSYARG